MNILSKPATIDLTASEMAAAIAAKTLSPVVVVEDALARIDKLDSVLRAWALCRSRRARATAKVMEAEAKAGKLRGPLHGVPIGIKDVLHAADMPTIANSRTTDPDARYPDSPVVAALRRAGAIILGKCETVEFAGAGIEPETRNPVEHRSYPRWIQFRVRRCSRCSYGTDDHRHADRRLDTAPCRLLRRRRLQAELRSAVAQRHLSAGMVARPSRHHCALRRRS